MSDEFKSLAEENEEKENSDYAVYKLEYDNDMKNIIISYSAKQDCKIFIGFYNDEGTQLYTSVTADVPEGTNAQMAVERPDSLPDYYLIKAFMVGQFNNPVSKSCTYDKCTKAVQDILAKKPEDFDEKKVVLFNETDDFNFIVTKNECVKIYSDDTKDTIIENNDPDTYKFENINAIKNIKEGQDVLLYTINDIELFRVESISIDGTNATIKKQVLGKEELVEFVKFDSSEYRGKINSSYTEKDAEYVESCEILSNRTSQSEVNENGISRKPAPSELKGIVLPQTPLSDSFRFDLKSGVKSEDGKTNISVGSYIKIDVKLNIEVFFTGTINILKGDLTLDVEFGINATLSDRIELGELSMGVFGVSVSVIPTIRIKLSGRLAYTISKTYDFICIPYLDTAVSEREFGLSENQWNYSIDTEVSIGLNCGINCLSKHIARLSIEPMLVLTLRIHNSKDIDNDYTRHDCDSCVALSLALSAKVKGEFRYLDFIKPLEVIDTDSSYGFKKYDEYNNSDSAEIKKDLYKKEAHIKNGHMYDGPCENISHKIIIHVEEESRDSNGELITKPSGKATLYSGKYVVDDLKFKDKEEKDILTNDDGEAELWIKDKLLTDEDYCITIKTADNKVGMVRVGESWDPTLNQANEFNVVIKEDAVTVDPDGGLEYPKRGNCGVKRTTLLGEIKYDRVEYFYWADGICEIQGTGTLDGGKLSSDLEKLGVKTLDKLVICGGVNLADDETATYINREIKIKEIDFYGCHDGTLVSTFGSRNELKKVDLSWFDRIGDSAFLGCQGLETILWYDSLKEIGKKAFMGNSSLKKIVFPKTLKTIDDEAFNWSGLNEITLNNGLETIGISAFRNTALKSINIPASVKKLGLEAFCDCKSLKTVIINGDFETDGIPFYNSPVTTLVINDGVTEICERLMQYSTTLNNVRFSKQLEKIGAYAFEGTGLKYIILPGNLKIVEEGAFRNSNLKSVVIPENVISIGDEAFKGNPITKLELPDSLESIGRWAFAQTQLDSVIVPENVNFIGMGAFFNGNIINGIGSENDQDKALTTITVRNPECELGTNFVSNKTKIYGYTGSTAEAYANKYGNPFKALDAPAVTTTTAATTTTATTTTAAVVTTQVAPDSECVFIAVKDKDTAGASSDKVFADGNVKYFDQQTADANGVVSFSYLPDEKEKWAFIFVSQVINDTITKTFGTAEDLKTTTYNVAPGVKGDANGDGEIDMSDVVLIMQALANPNKYGIEGTDPKHISENGFKYADSDGDGLTVNDALRIQQYLLGIIPALT